MAGWLISIVPLDMFAGMLIPFIIRVALFAGTGIDLDSPLGTLFEIEAIGADERLLAVVPEWRGLLPFWAGVEVEIAAPFDQAIVPCEC